MRRRSTGLAAGAAVFALAVLLVRSWRSDYPYSIDFQTYWLAGSRVLHGEAENLYAPGGVADGLPAELSACEFKNLPVVAVAFAPFGAVPYPTAKRAFWWLSLAAIVATAWVIGRWLVPESIGPVPARVLGAFAVLGVMAPTHIALRHGQTTPFVVLLVAAWWALLVRRRPGWAGVALAGACLIKFPPFGLLALDTLRARWRAVAGCLAALAVVGLLSVVLFGPALHRVYAAGVLEQSGAVMTGHNNQSLTATVTRVFEPVPLNDWTPRPVPPVASWALRFVALALAVAAGFHIRRVRDLSLARLPFEGLAAIALGVVVLPVAWDHYFLLLAPGMIAAASALLIRRDTGLIVGLLIAFLLVAVPTPSAWLERGSTSGWLDGLRVSHYFLGAVVAVAVSLLALRRT